MKLFLAAGGESANLYGLLAQCANTAIQENLLTRQSVQDAATELVAESMLSRSVLQLLEDQDIDKTKLKKNHYEKQLFSVLCRALENTRKYVLIPYTAKWGRTIDGGHYTLSSPSLNLRRRYNPLYSLIPLGKT